MYYKEQQDVFPDKAGNKLWRPAVVRTGKTVGIKALSKHISTATTLTESDITAVLLSLPQFMNIYLKEGHTVRLDGLGTFAVYGRSKGKGVIDKEDVRPSQFSSLVLKFTPEYTVSTGGTRTRTLLDGVEFTHINRLLKGFSADSDNAGGNDDGNDDDFIDPEA